MILYLFSFSFYIFIQLGNSMMIRVLLHANYVHRQRSLATRAVQDVRVVVSVKNQKRVVLNVLNVMLVQQALV